LLHEFRQLAGLVLDEPLDVRQSRVGDVTRLTRAPTLRLGFRDRDIPELAFLREGRLGRQKSVVLVREGGLARSQTWVNACPTSAGTAGNASTWLSRVASAPRQVSNMRVTVLGEPVPSRARIFSTVGRSPAVTSASAAALTWSWVMPLAIVGVSLVGALPAG
jgi:hypothetical protein